MANDESCCNLTLLRKMSQKKKRKDKKKKAQFYSFFIWVKAHALMNSMNSMHQDGYALQYQ